MTDEVVVIPPAPTPPGPSIDNTGVMVGGVKVLRQRQNIADPSDPAGIAAVKATGLAGTEYAIAARTIVSDGLDATQGAIDDAAATGDSPGTISAKLRGLTKILADVWNSGTHVLNVAIAGALAAGSNIIGKVGIDQTTPGVTNKVSLGSDVVSVSGTVGITDSIAAAVSSAWNSGTALNATNVIACASMTTVITVVGVAAGIVSGIVVYEASVDGGTTWRQVFPSNLYGAATGAENLGPLAGTYDIITFTCSGFTHFRTRLQSSVGGTGNVSITSTASTGSNASRLWLLQAGSTQLNYDNVLISDGAGHSVTFATDGYSMLVAPQANGTTGVAPGYFADYIGFKNAGGLLTGVSTTTPLPAVLGAGSAAIGTVSLTAGSANIGSVAIQAGQSIALAAGVANIGTVTLANNSVVTSKLQDGTGNALTSTNGALNVDTASESLTGAAIPTSAEYIGFNVGGILTGVSASNPLPVTGSLSINNVTLNNSNPTGNTTDSNIALALSQDSPIFTAITGDPQGDYAGRNIIELMMDPASGEALSTRVVNPPKADVQNAAVLSDAPTPIQIQLAVGQGQIIDTTGYQSLNITSLGTGGLAGTVTCSDDPAGPWVALSGTNRAIAAAYVTAITAGAGFSFPCIARYIRIVSTTAGAAVAYLRAAPWQPGYATPLPENITQWGSSAVLTGGIAGSLAVGGNVANAVAPTANPVQIAGVDNTVSAAGTSTPLTRRWLMTTAGWGQVAVNGQDLSGVGHPIQTDWQGATAIRPVPSSQSDQSITELLLQIRDLLRCQVQLEYDTPLMTAIALSTPGLQQPRSVGDEADNMLAEFNNAPSVSTIN